MTPEQIAELIAERDTLRAQLDALQSVDELPELPKKARGFFCTKCGSGECKPGWEDEKNPPCGKCDYLGYASDLDYSTEQMQSYTRQAQAMARAKLLAELEKVEAVAWVRRHPDGSLTGEFLGYAVIESVRKKSGAWIPLYTRPLPAQDVNAELAYNKVDRFLRNNLGDDDYAEYSEALDTLANAKAAQQKGQS